MKKIISVIVLGLCVLGQAYAAKKDDLVLIYRVTDKDNQLIYDKFVKDTIVPTYTGAKPRDYHVTVGWFRGIGAAPKFRSYMKKELKSQEKFDFVFAPAGFMTVAPKCPDPQNKNNPLNKKGQCFHQALALFPDAATLATLKRINKNLNHATEEYNKVNGTKYVMDPDQWPEYFQPHMTLANTKQIPKAKRQEALRDVTNKMKDNSHIYSVKIKR